MTLERVRTPRGELVLREHNGHFEIISNGTFLMNTVDGRSERLLVRAALAGTTGPVSMLIGGLGVGFSLVEALACDRVSAATVVEIEPAIVDWHGSHLAALSGNALRDPRVTVEIADLMDYLATSPSYHAICLDIDNGPQWTVTESNARLYDVTGLELLASRLKPRGVLAVWSAHASQVFAERLETVIGPVSVYTVEVPRGEPDVVYVARTKFRITEDRPGQSAEVLPLSEDGR